MTIKQKIIEFINRTISKLPCLFKGFVLFALRNRVNWSILHSINSFIACSRISLGKHNSFYIGKNGFISSLILNVKGRNNSIYICDDARLKSLTITIDGDNNSVYIGENSYIYIVSMELNGDNCSMRINNNCSLEKDCVLYCKGKKSSIVFGTNDDIGPNNRFVSMEGNAIQVGNDSMFSYDCEVRNTDSHSICGLDGRRMNLGQNVSIGDHCWLAQKCLILKGSIIPDNTIIGAGSIVNKSFSLENTVIAGIPATIRKEEVMWSKELIDY